MHKFIISYFNLDQYYPISIGNIQRDKVKKIGLNHSYH